MTAETTPSTGPAAPTEPADIAGGEIRQFRFVRPPGATSLLLIRHGESAPARPDEPFTLVDGQGDPELTPAGRQQALRVADRLAGEPITAIYVTTLRRTAETAAPLAERLHLVPVVEAGLREVHLGDWEGGLFRFRIAAGDPIAKELFAQERWDVIPGAEPAGAFAARVHDSLVRLAQRHGDQTIAVFTHGGVIGQAFAEAAASRPFGFSGAENGSISHLVITPERWLVRTFNDAAHLHSDFTSAAQALT